MKRSELYVTINKLSNVIQQSKDEMYRICRNYAKINAKFKQGDVVVRKAYRGIQYKVLYSVFNIHKDEIIYRVEVINRGYKIHEIEESALSLYDGVTERNVWKVFPTGRNILVSYERIAEFINKNPDLRAVDVASYFKIPLHTVYNAKHKYKLTKKGG